MTSVSVVVPTANRAHVVGRAIASVLAQTFADFELLVVDDGSVDETPRVLDAVADPRVRSLRRPRNGGPSVARNTALAVARGEWMTFLDDDNEWVPTYLERQLEIAASRPEAALIHCRAQVHDDHLGRDLDVIPPVVPDGPAFCRLVNGWQPPTSGSMVRRTRLLAAGGFDEELRVAEDFDLFLRLAQEGDFAGTAEALLIRHERADREPVDRTDVYASAVPLLQQRWGPVIEARCGPTVHRRWRTSLIAKVELFRARRAARAGRRAEAMRCAGRMLALRPCPAHTIVRVLVFTALGPQAYDRLAEQRRARA